MVVHVYNPSYVGGTNRRIVVQPSPGKKTQDPIQKITKAKKGWDMTQVVECLPSSYKALSSNPSTAPKKI
jgi:hypothetical protein